MQQLITPILLLIIWSLIIWVIMYARRIPAMHAAKINPQDAAHPGALDSLPPKVRAGADNYNHLMEQPTIFYALALLVMHMDVQCSVILICAWAYVILRILHSLVQITSNRVILRFGLFALSSLVLMVMAGMTVWHSLVI